MIKFKRTRDLDRLMINKLEELNPKLAFLLRKELEMAKAKTTAAKPVKQGTKTKKTATKSKPKK